MMKHRDGGSHDPLACPVRRGPASIALGGHVMPITARCTGCGQTLSVADCFARMQGKCPSCNTIVTFSEAAGTVSRPVSGHSAALDPDLAAFCRDYLDGKLALPDSIRRAILALVETAGPST
jgi:phage FluMu protein Com